MSEKRLKLISESIFDYTMLFEGGVSLQELHKRIDFLYEELIKPQLKEGQTFTLQTKNVPKTTKRIKVQPVKLKIWQMETDAQYEKRLRFSTMLEHARNVQKQRRSKNE